MKCWNPFLFFLIISRLYFVLLFTFFLHCNWRLKLSAIRKSLKPFQNINFFLQSWDLIGSLLKSKFINLQVAFIHRSQRCFTISRARYVLIKCAMCNYLVKIESKSYRLCLTFKNIIQCYANSFLSDLL